LNALIQRNMTCSAKRHNQNIFLCLLVLLQHLKMVAYCSLDGYITGDNMKDKSKLSLHDIKIIDQYSRKHLLVYIDEKNNMQYLRIGDQTKILPQPGMEKTRWYKSSINIDC
jgi:hypothetical protein